jgi:hypothetical protein
MVKRHKFKYADLYNSAYRAAYRHGPNSKLGPFVARLIERFRAAPVQLCAVPRQVRTLLRTQSIAQASVARGDVRTSEVEHSIALVCFIERRAARIIASWVLHMIYRPGGAYIRERLRLHAASALCCK